MKTAAFLCVALLFFALLPTVEAIAPGEPANGIAIDGDVDLQTQASMEGWPGDGTEADPFIMDKMNFTAAYTGPAVYIGNTTLHLRLRDCVFENQSSAVILYAAANVSFEGCQFRQCYLGVGGVLSLNTSVYNSTFSCTLGAVVLVDCRGLDLRGSRIYVQPSSDGFVSGLSLQNCSDIYAFQSWFYNGTNSLSYCSNATFLSCDFRDCEAGLDILESDKMSISASTMNNGLNGVVLGDNSTNMTMQGSNFNSCAIRFDAVDAGTYSTLIMDSTYVRGKPFYFLKDTDPHGASITSDAQQVLLFNVSNAHLIDLRQQESNGVTLAYCSNVVVRDSAVTGLKEYGVRLVQSMDCIVRNCTFTDGLSGVELWYWGSGNRVEDNMVFDSRMGIGVHQQQERPEVSSNTIVNGAIGIILAGQNAFAWNNSLVNCSIGGISASDGAQVVLIGNQVLTGGYGFRLARLDESIVQQNEFRATEVGIIVDGDNSYLYITDNLMANCTSHGIRVHSAGDGIYIAHNRLLFNNGAGTVYSPSHIQTYDPAGFANWNQTGDWGNYWSDWTSTSYEIGAYNISAVAKDLRPYPMLRCGPPADLSGKFTGNNLTIAWKAPSYPGFQEARSYVIYRGDSVNNMTRIGTVAATVTTFTDRGLDTSTYFYQISAINDYGEGSRSGVLEASRGSSTGSDLTLLLIALLLVMAAMTVIVLVTRKRR